MQCLIKKCNRKMHSRGLCGTHYSHCWRTNDWSTALPRKQSGRQSILKQTIISISLTERQLELNCAQLSRHLNISRQGAWQRLQTANKNIALAKQKGIPIKFAEIRNS